MANSGFGIIAPHPPILVPDVGGSRAETARATLDALARAASALAEFAPDTIVVMSPHAPLVQDAIAVDGSERFEGSLSQFGAPHAYSWPGDPVFAEKIVSELTGSDTPGIARHREPRLKPGWLDHAVIVPLSFLEPMQRVPIVVISLSFLPYADHRAVGQAVRRAAASTGRKIAFVASGDLSHRLTQDAPAGYSPRAQALDEAIVAAITEGNLSRLSDIDPGLIDAGGECGLRSFIALSGFEDGGTDVQTRVLAYEGPWGVGYLTALVGKEALEACDNRVLTVAQSGRKGGSAGGEESEIVRLARRAIEARIAGGAPVIAPTLDADTYPDRAGAFVSLHRNGDLRGCIGTILPTKASLAEEVVANAVEAATRDPRFPPLAAEELAELDIKVDVLHAPESCSLDELDPQRFGVITTSGWRRGLLLPDLEGVDDAQTQVAIAMQKAGINRGEPCSYERFRVDRYT